MRAPYARKVEAALGHDNDPAVWPSEQRAPEYRLYEVQNGKHIETLVTTFPRLELIEPHAHQALDLPVAQSRRSPAAAESMRPGCRADSDIDDLHRSGPASPKLSIRHLRGLPVALPWQQRMF